jgi:steroid delta-isomerase-like uncharacterized protein
VISDADRQLLARHLAAENEHRMDDTLATLTEDCVFDDRGLGRVWHGREGARAYYDMWWSGFGATVHTERRHYTDAGAAIVETRFRGVHEGTFLGIVPTGRAVDVELAIFIELRDGLMTGERFYWDVTSLLRQLGVTELPPAIAG